MMHLKSSRSRGGICGLVIILLGALALPSAEGQTITTLDSFNGTDGWGPYAGLIADANGNLFGTTQAGGPFFIDAATPGDGTVFEVPYNGVTGSYAATPTMLVSFNGTNGASPTAGLIADANGNLFGTTQAGGATSIGAEYPNDGTVFEVPYNNDSTPPSYGTAITLVSFFNTVASTPTAGLIADADGNLFGTTFGGTFPSEGTVFEIPYNATALSYATTPTMLVNFNGTNGAIPQAGLIADANGNLFGTTQFGGAYSKGTVFEIPYNNNSTPPSYGTVITLVSFNGTNGALPYAGLIVDANGNLFGTTSEGGASGDGTVFEVPYNTATGSYATALTTLVSFSGTDGANPTASLIADANGNLFGTTQLGGAYSEGTVFEIPYNNNSTPPSYGTVITPVNFNGMNGGSPIAGLIADANGNLFGTTQAGGASFSSTNAGYGTVFELSGSGFIAPGWFVGTPGTANCVGVSTSTLAHTYGGLAHAASGLKFTSVSAMESAISSYCSQ